MKTFTRIILIAIVNILFAGIAFSQVPKSGSLVDNGPYVTHPGGGPGGSDYSFLEHPPLSHFGASCEKDIGYRLADDFIILADSWEIDSIELILFENETSTTSTISEVNLQIWNGYPDSAGSAVIWGDLTTNRLNWTTWSGCYRGDDLINTTRPLMRCICQTPGLSLDSGIYWLDWQADGIGSYMGPWNSWIAILGQPTTGNALQYSNSTGVWSDVTDNIYHQGLPFIIYGIANAPEITFSPGHLEFALEIGQVDSSLLTIYNAGILNLNYNLSIEYLKKNFSWLSINITSGIILPGDSNKVIVTVNSSGLPNAVYQANIVINSNDPVNPQVVVPVTLDVITFVPGQENKNILIYPNPTDGFFNITSGILIQKVILVNNLGQVVFQQDCQDLNLRINTQGFSSGIYTIQLQTIAGTVYNKIIIGK